MTRYLVTSALPYANGPIHFGQITGAYLPADVYVRTLRMQQFRQLQEQVRQRLKQDAIVKTHPQIDQVAMDMVMQRYATWKNGAASAR